MSISQLSARSNVSSGMISQIERGSTNPSIKTLERLHVALGVPLTALLEGAAQEPAAAEGAIIRRVTDRLLLRVGTEGVVKELLGPRGDHDVQMMIIELPRGAGVGEVMIGSGEKAGWILEGAIKLTVDGTDSLLAVGDSFQFSSNVPHSIRNVGEGRARLIWITCVQPTLPHL